MEKILAFCLLVVFLGGCKGTDSEVTVSYEGQGRILGEGIDCGSECETTLNNSWLNSQKNKSYKSQLSAEPEPGFEFFAWYGNSGNHFNTPCGTDTQCNITIRSMCNELLDLRPILFSCSDLEGNSIRQHGIFVAEGSVLTSAAYRDRNRCLITVDGQLKCWGAGIDGANTPVIDSPYAVKVSSSSACAAGSNGLHCWGSEPVANNIPMITDLVDFDVSNDTGCAIDGDQVLCWGDTGFLQPMPTFTNPSAIWLDQPMACVQDQSELKCWGPLASGQSKPPSLAAPSAIAVIDDITGPDISCALDGNELKCWGAEQSYTAKVSGLANPSELTFNNQFLCYSDDSFGVRCVANAIDSEPFLMPYRLQDNTNLQLGQGGYLCSTDVQGLECWNARLPGSAPTRPLTMGQPVDFDIDGDGGCAIKGDQLQCWDITVADDIPAQIALSEPEAVATNGMVACVGGLGGVECFTSVQTPSQIVEYQPTDLANVTDLAMSSFYACAIHDGQVSCWGNDNMGVLEVPPLSNPTQLALGRYHGCALDDTGVVCWGEKVAVGR